MNNENQLDIGKYENAALYFINHCNNSFLGKTKINKLFYYLDFISYRDGKKSVTGDSYTHNKLGPVPDSLLTEIIPRLKEKRKIDITESEISKDGETFITYKFIALENPDMSFFNLEEIRLLKNICKEFNSWTSDKMVEQTHFEAPWFYSLKGEKIDFEYARDIDFFQDQDN
jgi:uncharacterized phage-associated protein